MRPTTAVGADRKFASLRIPSMPARRDAPAVRIDHRFAVFFDEWTELRQRQNIEHHFRRSAKFCSPRCDDDRTVDENRKLEHSVEFIVGPMSIAQAQLRIGRIVIDRDLGHWIITPALKIVSMEMGMRPYSPQHDQNGRDVGLQFRGRGRDERDGRRFCRHAATDRAARSDTARPSRAQASRRLCRSALPGWRYGSWRCPARHRTSASHRAGTQLIP